MNVLTFDTEAAGPNKANPFSRSSKLCCVGLLVDGNYSFIDIEHGLEPYAVGLEQIASVFEQAELIVAFNSRYDLHWLRRYIPGLRIPPVWDCQLAEFILSAQTVTYPSLDGVLAKFGLPLKDNRIKDEYWSQGRSTLEIPIELLREYNEYDCRGTYEVYKRQAALLQGNQAVLFRLHCDDLLVLAEMEFNGLLYDSQESLRLAEKVKEELNDVYTQLVPFTLGRDVNWNSPRQCSAVLYGGTIPHKVREATTRVLKDGTVKLGERWGEEQVVYPRLCEPLKGTELESGAFSTDEANLRSLKPHGPAKTLIKHMLKVAELSKLCGTYYEGLPKIIEKMDWEPDTLHGNINQCVTKTGRTSSTKPNVQNFDPKLKPLFYSRYAETTDQQKEGATC